MPSSRPLSEQVVLITGAARGIGAGIARQAAARGAKVSLVGIEPDELAKVAAECGPNAAWFEADVTEVEEIETAVQATVERFGGIDVLVVNAGIASGGTIRTVDPASFERVLEVNLMGSWRTIRAAIPHVIERKGYVLQVASAAAIAHPPVMAAYDASKAGVEAMANALRTEVAYLGVDVGVAYYSWIDTDMVRGADERPLGRRKMAGPLGKSTSLEDTIAKTIEGIERRRRWITVPGWVRGTLLLRGPLQVLIDFGARRQMRSIEGDLMAAIAREGAEAVSAPVGAGGAADTRTHAEHLAHEHEVAHMDADAAA
jgi:NAD(P)-dependent dehydrogenase (short-subunit alcohol dehydrogenase family)